MNQYYELNIDGLVGPSHHYAGLALGNIASETNALNNSNPQAAALQGLAKMRWLFNLGLKQAIFPPHPRPNLALLSSLGFIGSPMKQITAAYKKAPWLLSASYSSAGMWTANASTVSASLDSQDQKVHFTAANLISNLHRQQEANFSHNLLKLIFNNPEYFYHHPILPDSVITSDEGAANHGRICLDHNQPGISLFVYGKNHENRNNLPKKYPARQTLAASAAIARAHQLNEKKIIFALQNPKAIDQGVFHNDVISVVNENVFLIHEEAFVNQELILQELEQKADFPLHIIKISNKICTVADAVKTYLFNSQLITLPATAQNHKKMILLAPIECQKNSKIHELINEILAADNPLSEVHYFNLQQSMQNGGGPACLRLRVPLNATELAAMHQGVLLNEELFSSLELWVKKYYRSQLNLKDLADPQLIDECFTALDKLTALLNLGSIYPFQQ